MVFVRASFCKALTFVCYSVKRLRDDIVLKMYYYASIHSVLCYRIIAWGVSLDFVRVF